MQRGVRLYHACDFFDRFCGQLSSVTQHWQTLQRRNSGGRILFHADGLKASVRQMLVFGPAMLLAFF
jgi:hypothetical protein